MTVDEDEAREQIAEWREIARRVDDAGTEAAFEMCADTFEEHLDEHGSE